jgi:DNA-binding winged helix-turn-helix (wHTH) protein
MYQWEDLHLNPEACEVSYKGQTLQLYPKEYHLLKLFLEYPNHVLSSSAIIERLWEGDSIPTLGAIRTHLKGLRHKLKQVGVEDFIQTVHGLGYRLKPLPKQTNKSSNSLSPMLQSLLSLHYMEYAIADKNLTIDELSFGVEKFSDYPLEAVRGKPVTLAFPELIGFESILLEVIDNHRPNIEIKGIARSSNSLRPDYINIYAIAEQTEASSSPKLLLLFEDASETMILKQQVVQKQNESYLLLIGCEGTLGHDA